MQLAEYRRSCGPSDQLRHLVVLEEAHRLLSNSASTSGEASGKQAIEAFINLLAEVRALGQGVVIADQVPGRLVPEVLKNTNLKLAHRLVAEDDRQAVGATMVANSQQIASLATLSRGVAAAFCEGEDAPLLVSVESVKDELLPLDDKSIRHAMVARGRQYSDSKYEICALACSGDGRECDKVHSDSVGSRVRATVFRCIESMLELPNAIFRLWSQLEAEAQAEGSFSSDHEAFLRCHIVSGVWTWAQKRAVTRGWTYSERQEMAHSLIQAMLLPVSGDGPDALKHLHDVVWRLHERKSDPYPYCSEICFGAQGPCLHRETAEAYVASGQSQFASGKTKPTWANCREAAGELMESPDVERLTVPNALLSAGAGRLGRCVGQAAIFRSKDVTVKNVTAIRGLLDEAAHIEDP